MAAIEINTSTDISLGENGNHSENMSVTSEDETDEIIERLHDVTALTIPDRDIPSSLDDSDSTRSTDRGETESLGAVSNPHSDTVSEPDDGTNGNGEIKENGGNTDDENEANESKETLSDSSSPRENGKSESKTGAITKDSQKKKSSNPVKGLLKKLTKSSKSSDSKSKLYSPRRRSGGEAVKEDLAAVTIDKLPQCFIVKYLGKRECNGLWGIKHVRKPVDEMVKRVTKQLESTDKPVELPLMYLVVSHKGLELREHHNNRMKEDMPAKGPIPIDFISYGVQDLKFWRVFTFIVVQELSSRTKKMDCHAFICDSSVSARKIALSLAFAFKVNMRKLKQEGKEHRFQVDLRPPDVLADKYTESEEDAAEAAEC